MVLLESDKHALARGKKAPNFSLQNVDETKVSLQDFAGKILVVIFMCNHCPYVKPKMKEISLLCKDFVDVSFVCINSNDPTYDDEDSFENMKDVATRFDYPYYLVDEAQDVAKAYGAVCTPDVFVFDKNHELVYRGRINDAMNPGDTAKEHTLREALEQVQKGLEIENWFRPSRGCSIKWK